MEAQSPRASALKLTGPVMAMIAAATLVAAYAVWRVDQVQKNIELVNRIHVPALKQLNLVSGKWPAWQRSFEQSVGFRTWGDKRAQNDESLSTPRIRLKKYIESNLNELTRVLTLAPSAREFPERDRLAAWVGRAADLADREPVNVAEISTFVKSHHLLEAASSYSRARQEQLELGQDLVSLTSEIEQGMSRLQFSIEDELKQSQSIVLFLLMASIGASLVVLVRLRRWFVPVLEWTEVAKDVAVRGVNADTRFPKPTRSMPEELAVLTREFSRMARTVLDREKTIRDQGAKTEVLAKRLKVQNERLTALGGKLSHARKLALVGEMSSQIAHEVRNPLNSMSLHLDMLEEDLEGAAPAALERVRSMREQVERLERVTRSYLDMTKSRNAVSSAKVDLHETIEQALAFLSGELQVAQVHVELDLAVTNAFVSADADAISQVVFNLVRNAVDELQNVPADSRKVRIETADEEGSVRIRVIDTGRGVPKELAERLFEPFSTTKVDGHGLGLSVSRQICIDHGGELRYVVGVQDQGACFEFTLKHGGLNA